jgi:hypothetical protein
VDHETDVQNTNSAYVADAWKYSNELKDVTPETPDEELPEDHKAYVKEKSDAVDAAKEVYDAAEKEYIATTTRINGWKSRIETYRDGKQTDRDAVQAEYDENDKKLNGTAFDKIVVDLLDGKNAVAVGLSALLGGYGSITGEDIENAVTMGSDILNIYNAIDNGEVNQETLESVSNILTGDILATRTKYAISSYIEDKVAEMHHDAVETLKADVDAGLEAVSAAADKVANGTATMVEQRLILDVAEAAEKVATALSDEADAEAEAAKKANAAAQDALDKVEQLQTQMKDNEVDGSAIAEAEAVYEAANAYAEQANTAYEDARKEAQSARISANHARRAANRLHAIRNFFFG